MRTFLRRAAATTGATTAALVLLGATAAYAAASITVTDSAGKQVTTTVTANDALKVVGHIDPLTNTTNLVVFEPGQTKGRTVASGSTSTSVNGKDLTWTLATACVYGGSECGPAVNGKWTFALQGGARQSRTVTLLIPPAQVAEVAATAQQTAVTLTWKANREPDLRTYDVTYDGTLLKSVKPDEVCADGGCGMMLDLGPGSAGEHTFTVRANRAECPDCAGTVAGQESAPATVTVTEPAPSPSGTPAPGGGTGGTGGTGGSAGGATGGSAGGSGTGSTVRFPAPRGGGANAGSFDSEFRTFVPGVRAVPAPPAPGVITTRKPLPDGTYKPTLAYPDQVEQEKVLVRKPLVAAFTDTVGHVVDSRALWTSIAVACLLMLAAAHLRAWVGRSTQDW